MVQRYVNNHECCSLQTSTLHSRNVVPKHIFSRRRLLFGGERLEGVRQRLLALRGDAHLEKLRAELLPLFLPPAAHPTSLPLGEEMSGRSQSLKKYRHPCVAL